MQDNRALRTVPRLFLCGLLLIASLPYLIPGGPPVAQDEPKGVYCPVCGSRNNPRSRFCARDGTPLPEIVSARYQVGFVRALETYSPEEIQQAMDHTAGSVVRIRSKTQMEQKHPVTEHPRGYNIYFGRMEKVKGEERFAGSGFALGPPGEIVTNAHVASPGGTGTELTVETRDGRTFPARVVGLDIASDLALLKIDTDTLPPLAWGDSDGIDIGDDTWAIGNPLDVGISITRGTISSLARLHAGVNQVENFIHSDAFITHGNSGGPLVDAVGRVVGLSDVALLETKGKGFFIPSNMARLVTDRLRKSGKYERGFLGLQGRPVDEKSIEKFGIKRKNGLVVESVLAGSPAEKAGFRPGDVLIGINGHQATAGYILQEAISSLGPGAAVKMAVDRGGSVVEIPVVTAPRPDAPRIDPVADLERYLQARFEEDPKGKGVVLRIPDSFSVAHRYNLEDGAVIQGVLPAQDWPEKPITYESYKLDTRNVPVKNLGDLRTALRRAYLGGRVGVTFLLKPDGRAVYSVAFDEDWPVIL